MTSDESWYKKSISGIKKFFQKPIKPKDEEGRDDDIFFDSIAFDRLERPQQEIIKSIIELPNKNAREIMIPRVDVISTSSKTTLKALLKLVTNTDHTRIPVYDGTIDNIIGILYLKDIFKFLIDKPRNFQLRKNLHKPHFIPETIPLDDLLLEFKKIKLHIAIVVDEYGGFSGILTLEDILEEIVGEINNSANDELHSAQKIGKNIYKVDSRMPISDFNEEAGIYLPTDEFDTIGGFVFDLFGKIPQKNETVKYENTSFKISDIKGTRIDRILIRISGREQD
ncbi:MAG: hemolysin family protein [Spirochaetota bacterium]|nr:hemolysin family protein [Spirochaetota bacterium]